MTYKAYIEAILAEIMKAYESLFTGDNPKAVSKMDDNRLSKAIKLCEALITKIESDDKKTARTLTHAINWCKAHKNGTYIALMTEDNTLVKTVNVSDNPEDTNFTVKMVETPITLVMTKRQLEFDGIDKKPIPVSKRVASLIMLSKTDAEVKNIRSAKVKVTKGIDKIS